MTARRTIVVHTTLSGHMPRVDAARRGEHGVQVLTMAQLAGRSPAASCSRSILTTLREAVQSGVVAGSSLGDLDAIKDLPGMVRAAVDTLDKVWRAGIDLSTSPEPRLEGAAHARSRNAAATAASMKRPAGLVELACRRIRHAPKVHRTCRDPWP